MDFVLIRLIFHYMFYIYIYQYVYPKLRILHHMLLGLSEGSHGILKATLSLLAFSCHSRLIHGREAHRRVL